MSKTVQIRLIAGIAVCFLALSAEAQYSGGTGEANDPYQIATAEDLITLGEEPNDYDKHFILTADIDLDPNLPGGKVFDRAVIAPDVNDAAGSWGWHKFDGTPFTGVFDGNDHTILHLTIEGGGYLGLFGQTGSGARISNLGLEAVDVSGTGDRVGGLVGDKNEGSVTSCYSTGAVTGNDEVGGLVGESDGSSIAMSYNTGTVTGHFNVGGLVGESDGSSIATSYSTGTVSGVVRVGGLVGYNGGSITSSYNTGTVSGESQVGGLVGTNDDNTSTTMSYSTGLVSGEGDVGGLVGFFGGGRVASCFWDMETSGQPTTSSRATGLTTAEMQDINTYLSEGWDFADEILNGTCDYWQISPGEYPRLRYQDSENLQMPEGLGTAEQPYLIRDARDLGTVWLKPTAHYRLETSLDLSGTTWSMPVVPRFDGTFDGNGHVISNLHIQAIQRNWSLGLFGSGLFGQLDSRANISNLGLEAVDANGNGCLAGTNYGSIRNSYSTGTVSGGGVLVNVNNGRITNSYSIASVTGGGLVGRNAGTITSSYCTGGGLVGSHWLGGNSGSITSSVWDMETSGLTGSDVGSDVGVGLTTAEMMDPYILGLNGFANDPNWVLDAGRDYPRLAWEGTAGQIIPEPIIDWLDGQGTDQEPYRVDMADQLILLGRASVLWDKHFILGADINLDPNLPGRRVFSQAVIPVFSGVFDGNNHTISHLMGEGLFGQTDSGARISNLALEAVDVNGRSSVGGLVGSNSGSISNCYSAGVVTGDDNVGGLVGVNNGSISNCYSAGVVTGNEHVGGLVGFNYEGSITTSYSTVTVTGDASVGGLVGTNGQGSITSSYSKGSITSSYSTGSVNGNERVGGLVGWNWRGSITSSYSAGRVRGNEAVGGLVGYNEGTITSSFWDVETSGQTTSEGGTGVTTAEMHSLSTYLVAGWDFVDETTNGTDDIWSILEGQGYPRLRWEKLYVDDDAPDDPGPGNPQISDPLENGRQAHPFDSIQEAIDSAPNCLTILVRPGQYLTSDPWTNDEIDFGGKNIRLKSIDPTDANTANDTVIRGAVLFSGTEDPNCMLAGFKIYNPGFGAIYGEHTRATISHCIISGNGPCGATVVKDCDGTISNCLITDNTTFFFCGVFPVVSGCNGLIKNCTIANNISGVSVGTATIENCIIYGNAGSQLGVSEAGTLSISYSNVQGGLDAIVGDGDVIWGPGNTDIDPCFVRSGYCSEEPLELIEGDYHLRSEGWRWNTESKSWTYDYVTSRCIDAGNPGSALGEELMTVPRDPDSEWGVNLRINMGAFGGTRQASMPPYGWAPLADLNNDGRVDYVDFAEQAEDWLSNAGERPGDLNRDRIVDLKDIAALAENWLQIAGWVK